MSTSTTLRFSVISLYTGAGGLDYGFEAAGFATRVAVEMDSACCETIRLNRDWPIVQKDIHECTPEEILCASGLRPGEVDVLIGGPPCQPFSKMGYWASGDSLRMKDPRAGTLHAYMTCVREMLPRVFLLENVHGIAYSGKEEGFRLLHELTEAINRSSGSQYHPSWAVLDAADYGVPQHRRRFFLIAHRDGKRFQFPSPTHGDIEANGRDRSLLDSMHALRPYTRAWDAIGGLKTEENGLEIRGRWAALLPSIPEGNNYLWHTDRGGGLPLFGWRTRFWNFLLKLAKDRPSWTIPAQPGPAIGPFHWDNRMLSAEELARLQTFPRDFRPFGDRASVQRQLGNAVPSLLAETLAREIARQLFGHSCQGPRRLAVRRRKVIPEPNPVAPVPKCYLGLVGDYKPHPGTGRGPGAVARRKSKTEDLLFDVD